MIYIQNRHEKMKKRYYKRYYHKFQSRTIANSIDFQTKEISMLFVLAYSTDLKLRVTSYVEEGHTLAQTAAIFNKVHPWSIIHWRKKYEATGNVENPPNAEHRVPYSMFRAVCSIRWLQSALIPLLRHGLARY